MNALIALIGRVLMSAIFIDSGWGKVTHFQRTIGLLASHGLPVPPATAAGVIAIELLGGLAILAGFRTKPVALGMAAYCVATAFIAHYHPGDTNQMIHFMKNICMAGGFLQLAAWGAGRYSIDRR
ncbi:MAG: DoxX family protein [Proteobacteria bacterium]|nr:DoxX family protein [Pseudomonadota bacterium]